MKILIIHNKYGHFSGEEAVVESQINLLKEKNHEVLTYFRSSEELESMPYGKVKAFFSGIYNPNSIKDLKQIIFKENPDLIHIHNLYPFISPAILPMINKMGIPIVMTVHNYRLFCPSGLFFNKGKICEKCTGKSKELNCITNNCEDSIFKSTGYALRNFWARTQGQYLHNVDAFISLSSFHKNKLIKNGLMADKCYVIPHMYNGNLSNKVDYQEGAYIGYVGRLSSEKGSEIILKLAKELPHINFKIAGAIENKQHLEKGLKNIEFLGFLNKNELNKFYSNSLFTLFTSICNETFGLSIIEAFAHSKPVIATDLGASPEIITKNGESGLIYKNNDLKDLIEKVTLLHSDKNMIKEMGQKGFHKLHNQYAQATHYQDLMKVYTKVLA